MNAGERLPGAPAPARYWQGTDDLRLAGDTWGDPNAPLVFLLHGGGQTRHAWRQVGERLGEAGFHAVAFDARGHGDSEWSRDGDYELTSMARDLQRVAAGYGAARPALVGASMGGLASLTALGEGMLDASALVLVDVTPVIDEKGRANIVAFMRQKPDGFESLDEVADAIAAYQPHRRRARNLDGLAKNVRRMPDGRFRWHWDPRFVEHTRADPSRGPRLREYARRVACPALLVRGALSDIVSEEGARDFLELCPHSEFVNVEDAAHMVAGDRNDIFGSALIGFLERVLRRP